MYHIVRRIHLAASFGLLLFVVTYFATGFVMTHEQWFKQPAPATTERKDPLQYQGEGSDEDLSRYLQTTFNLNGQRNPAVIRKDGLKHFLFSRPGTTYDAVIAQNRNEVTITQRKSGLVGLLHGLHRLHGYGGGGLYSTWSFLYDLSSSALIVFAFTGIFLWFRSTTKRLPGWICLGVSFGGLAAMMVYLMASK